MLKSSRLSDVCKSLHSNFDAARKAFAKWYMEPFGSAAMDDLEKQRLYFPMEAHSSLACRRGTSFDPVRNTSNGERKRRRISYKIGVATETLPDSESLSLANTPSSMTDTPGQTTANEEVINSSTSESSELSRNVIHWHDADFPRQPGRFGVQRYVTYEFFAASGTRATAFAFQCRYAIYG
jgi:hypothetical protein